MILFEWFARKIFLETGKDASNQCVCHHTDLRSVLKKGQAWQRLGENGLQISFLPVKYKCHYLSKRAILSINEMYITSGNSLSMV